MAALTLTESLPRLATGLRPVTVVGAMPLTAYVGHIAAIWALGIETLPGPAPYVWPVFAATAMAFAAVWSRCFARGPLEALFQRLCAGAVPGSGSRVVR